MYVQVGVRNGLRKCIRPYVLEYLLRVVRSDMRMQPVATTFCLHKPLRVEHKGLTLLKLRRLSLRTVARL